MKKEDMVGLRPQVVKHHELFVRYCKQYGCDTVKEVLTKGVAGKFRLKIMGAPVFLHVCVNWQTRDHMMKAMWMFLQHYPGAVLRKQDHRIVVPGVMTHFFVPADFDLDRLQGLELKGFSIEFKTKITYQKIEFLQSRVRG